MNSKIFVLILTITLLLPTILSIEEPTVTMPIAIDNIINIADQQDFAIYNITIINPTDKTIYFYFSEVSINWRFYYSEGSGYIYPKESKIIQIKMRPTKRTEELPIILLFIIYENKKYNYTVSFSPIVVNIKERIEPKLENITIDAYLSKEKVIAGENIVVYLVIKNPIDKNITAPLEIDTNFGYFIKKDLEISPGEYYISIPIKIPDSLISGFYFINISFLNITKSLNIEVQTQPVQPIIKIEENKIIITNPSSKVITYTFEKNISLFEKLFYVYNPSPDYEIIKDQKRIFVWELILIPEEEFIIERSLNFAIIAILTLLTVLLVLFLVVYYIEPKVLVKKEIVKIDPKNKEIKIMISIANNSFYKIKNVKIKESLLNIFEPISFDFIRPVGYYKKDNKVYIDWIIDHINKGEEIIITYSIRYSSEIVGKLTMDPTIVKFSTFLKEHKAKSNVLKLSFVKES